MFSRKNIRLISEFLVQKARMGGKAANTVEIRDFLNTNTKYGTTNSKLKAFMKEHPENFKVVGQTTVCRPSGRYPVDEWGLV